MKDIFICKNCKSEFIAYISSKRKYCSSKCSHEDIGKKHKAPWLTKRNLEVNAEQARRCADKIRASQPNLGKGNGNTYAKFYGRHEHRVVMENKLGRKLESWEHVHHIDENKRNNHPDNLELMTPETHASHHFKKYWKKKK